jgi:integrase
MSSFRLPNPTPPVHHLCMSGNIRTQKRCPRCEQKFPKELVCPTCQTRPSRYYIDLWHNGQRLNIFTDPYGYPLDSYARTEQLLSTIRHQIGSGSFDPKEYVAKELRQLQFEFYAQSWLDRLEQERLSRAYLKEVKRYTRSYFIPFFQRTNIRDIREGKILDFKRWLPAHLSNKTIANILGVLHRLLAEAFDRKDIAVLPKFPKVEKHKPDTKWLDQEGQERILAHLKEPYRSLFLFCMKHGCRIGEARALKWDCVDLKKNAVTIKASFDLGHWKPYTKEGDVRHLPLNAHVRQAIQALPRSLTGFIFVNSKGRPLSDTRVRSAWNQAAKAAGINISGYEGTRHSFATQKLMAGHSETFVMKATGHKTIESFRRYGKVMTEALRDMIEDDGKTASKIASDHRE